MISLPSPPWFVLREHSPHDPSGFVCHSDGGEARGLSLQEVCQPWICPLRIICNLPDARRHADDDELAQIPITHLRDLAQPFLATAGMVAWREPQPGSKLATASELVARPDRRGHRRCSDRSDTRNSLQELRLPAKAGLDTHRDLVPSKSVVQVDELTAENAQNVLSKLGKFAMAALNDPPR